MKLAIVLFGLFAVASAGTIGGRIFGGWDVQQGAAPWMVTFQVTFQPGVSDPVNFCGGSIIHETHIYTSGNCISSLPEGGYLNLVAGTTDLTLRGLEGVDVQNLYAKRVWYHELYNGAAGPFSVGLIRTATPFIWNSRVQPIALPSVDVEPVGSGTFYGWGLVLLTEEVNVSTQHLQAVNFTILSRDTCVSLVVPNLSTDVEYHETNFCTGPLDGSVGICRGDAGGPLVQNGVIIGTTSYGFGGCGDGRGGPTVWARTSAFVDWIKNRIAEP